MRTSVCAPYHERIEHARQPLRHLALASASPRRRELLSSLGLHVTVVASSYEEGPLPHLDPLALALAHARGKAAGAAPDDALIVAADTVVDLDGAALGKPRDHAESRHMIERLSGREHVVHTAFALRNDRTQQTIVHAESTRVRFRTLAPETIAAYVASGDGLDKAGAYGIQGYAATLVDRIEGDYFTVVGFPLAAFADALEKIGYSLNVPPSGTGSHPSSRYGEVPA